MNVILLPENVSGRLEIELTEPPVTMTPVLMNKIAPENAKIVSLNLKMRIYSEDFRPLTDDEWNMIAFSQPILQLLSESGEIFDYAAPDSKQFTVRDLVAAIEQHEFHTRNATWFGGIDVHHVFFEGIHWENNAWIVAWGS